MHQTTSDICCAMLAMSLLRSLFKCVSDRALDDNGNGGAGGVSTSGTLSGGRTSKIKFGVSLHEAFKSDHLPSPLKVSFTIVLFAFWCHLDACILF